MLRFASAPGLLLAALALTTAGLAAQNADQLPYASRYGTYMAADAAGNTYVCHLVRPQFDPVPEVTDGSTPPTSSDFGVWVAQLETDPGTPETLRWATWALVSPGVIQIRDVAVSPTTGDLYATGWTSNPGLATTGAFQEVSGGGRDVYVARFLGTDGSLAAFTYFSQPAAVNRSGLGITVAPTGEVVVTGRSRSAMPTTANAFDIRTYGAYDAFVGVLNGDLSTGGPANDGLLYGSMLPGGSGEEYGLAVAADGSGRIWVGGFTTSSDYQAPAAFVDPTPGGSWDGFVVAIDSLAPSSLVWGTLIGGAGDEQITGLTADAAAGIDVWATGSVSSDGLLPLPQQGLRGGTDAFVAAFGPGGALGNGRYLGGKGDDYGQDLRIDSSGRLVVAGSTQSNDFPTTTDAYDGSHNGRNKDDVFVTVLDGSSLALAYGTFLGGSNHDTLTAMHVDAADRVYLGGQPVADDFPFNDATAYASGGFVAVLDPNATGSPPPPPPPPPGNVSVDDITPDWIRAGTMQHVTVTGSGFEIGASVTFVNGSGPAPTASTILVTSDTSIEADVAVSNGGRGTWSVRVQNTSGSSGVLPDGFTIVK